MSCSIRRRRRERLAAALVLALLAFAASATSAGATVATDDRAYRPYRPPVDGVIVDRFRPPASPYAAGNRGVDEITAPDAPVVASADGVVVFAGPVGGALHVTVRHPDGLRTSYSYLAAVLVVKGQRVVQGQPIGVSAGPVHFGVRDTDGTYLDPEALWAGRLGAHLVPGAEDGERPLQPDDEWGALARLMASGGAAASALGSRALAIAIQAESLQPGVDLFTLAMELREWRRSQAGCTDGATPVPPAASRHIAVLVGGVGSTSESAAVDRVDLAGLAYAPSDVVRFSYAGGRVPRSGSAAAGPLEAVAASDYTSVESENDLRVSAARLRVLLDDVARAQPGVPIDVIAHSQGGVVVRLALNAAADEGALPTDLATVVTLGTPHRGADLATAVAGSTPGSPNRRAVDAMAARLGLGLDLNGPSIAQLSRSSPVIGELARPVPAGVRLRSIGASSDLVVPAVRTFADGAGSATVRLTRPNAHDQLPGDRATTREIGLALAGLAPTCVALADGMGDVLTSHLITQSEARLGLLLS